jgi:WD40 repeat protein
MFISGSKDNEIRLWNYTLPEKVGAQIIVNCLAVFKGHNQNVSGVCFAPKKLNYFVSVSQDNTIKVWDLIQIKG